MRFPRGVAQQIEIELIIPILKKSPLAPVAPLGYMMRDAGDDDSGEAGHGVGCSGIVGGVKGLLHVSPESEQARKLFALQIELDLDYLDRRIKEETFGDYGIDALQD